jgi:hypothetical protein
MFCESEENSEMLAIIGEIITKDNKYEVKNSTNRPKVSNLISQPLGSGSSSTACWVVG